ncbi:MAG: DUF4153 domain-containing protein [Balneola sp.]
MKLSLPSLDQIGAALLRMYKRFPFVIVVSVVGTVAALWLADLPYSEQDSHPEVFAIAFVSGLGISFLFGLATFLEQKSWAKSAKYGIQIVGLALLIIYWLALGDKLMDGPYEIWYRFFLFTIASHLFVAFAPFIGSENVDQFWEYNKSLFLRILLSVLYSGVLFIGLSVALLALDNLLNLDIDGESYFQLFLFLGGIFNTWFFLTGVPEKDEIREGSILFPKGLKVFVQYVLIPLVTAYIVILYLYLGKIMLQWELPNGWVSNLVLTFSIAGILSLLLLYPIRDSKDYNWIRVYSKGYYLALIPLIGLLMVSIWVRISEYGVTINRYFVATLGVWLTGIVVYFILSKAKSIKVIPISLCLIAIGVSFGPLGAFAVSERSQLGRFEEILEKYSMLDEHNKIIQKKEEEEVPFEDRKELSSLADYVVENHDANTFGKYFDIPIIGILEDSIADKETEANISFENDSEKIITALGIEYVEYWESSEKVTNYFRLASTREFLEDIKDFDYASNEISFSKEQNTKLIKSGDTSLSIDFNFEEVLFVLTLSQNKESIEIPMFDFVETLYEKYPNWSAQDSYIPISDMKLEAENNDVKVLLILTYISGQNVEGLKTEKLSAIFYIKEKQ